MIETSANNKRIAKNTLLLYVRTLFIMLVTLYTSRVVLNTLGVTDYGIYNVVGGVVAMFSVISGSLSSSISRFITYEIGHGDFEKLKRIFSASVNIQIGISLVILVLAELFGVWFLNTKMNIPVERLSAANWVLQCSLLSFIINLISVPYNACIIAHERMSAFAYISILEAVLKLAVVYMLLISPYDKLVTYAILLVLVSLIVRLTYSQYCKRHFEESRYKFVYDKPLVKEMTSFAGWSFFGNGAYMLNVQGVDMLINIFFGVTLNAARGVATQVQNAVMQFVNNFTVAVNPQITKSYAAGEMSYMHRLVCRGARFSYFLLLIFVVPLVCEADYVLRLWLKIVPEHAPAFLRLSLFGTLMTLLGNSMLTAVSATGNIKRYQLWITLVGCLVFPLTWVAFELGFPPEGTYVIYIVIYFLLNFIRLYIAKGLLNFPARLYLTDVMLRVVAVSVISFILPLLFIHNVEQGFLRLCGTCVISLLSTGFTIAVLGLEISERKKIIGKIVSIILKNKK
ncbi:MATE family efflux transporter [Bacteroides gallinaceum]|uniref:MATE family efflux transporter n=1 Tax=Bacteroides gallinaceum TaxID=1462571 RepID=A0ABT7X1T9_9BACE|nr:MATE family efflux transporter [Bacteroides gallinaceum]MDN0048055.1 MATE family efflux transporter [Bacteroides gallinaceum]